MQSITKFEKVSYEQFLKDSLKTNPSLKEEEVFAVYEQIKLPKRATSGSAGYDFFAPTEIMLNPGEETLIPTGIRVRMNESYVLMLFPRSSLGFKYRFQLNNTVGIIDADYYGATNEGHIFARVMNDSRSDKVVTLQQGEGMLQGIFVPFGKTCDDDTDEKRVGGIGSTNRKTGNK